MLREVDGLAKTVSSMGTNCDNSLNSSHATQPLLGSKNGRNLGASMEGDSSGGGYPGQGMCNFIVIRSGLSVECSRTGWLPHENKPVTGKLEKI